MADIAPQRPGSDDDNSPLWSFWSQLPGSSNQQSNAQVPVGTLEKTPARYALMDEVASRGYISLDDLVEQHEFQVFGEHTANPYIVASPRESVTQTQSQQFAANTDYYGLFGEIGTTSPSPWTSFTRQEYNQALVGIKGLQQYDKMRRSDGSTRGSLRLIKSPVLAARYFVQPGGTATVDQTAAHFMECALFEEMSTPWMQTITEALLMLDFGYYMFEKVFEPRVVEGTPRTVWKKLSPRHPMDVKQWHFDANGGPKYVEMYKPYSPDAYGGYTDSLPIPIEKLLVFTFDKEAGNIEGISVLRSAYKHWYFKDQLYKIDAIQKERHGIGIPIIKLPIGYSADDKRLAEELGRNIRTNERAHIVLPPNWDLNMLKLEGNLVDCLKSAEHHDKLIRANVLGEFLDSAGNGDNAANMFMNATKFVADIVVDTFNNYAIPQLHDWNFARGKCPKLRVRRIGVESDHRTKSAALRNYVGAKLIRPDDTLEAFLRDDMDLPPVDEDTIREVVTPQLPGSPGADSKPGADSNQLAPPTPARTGPPRQSQAANMQQTAQGTGKANTGRDGTGK